MFLPDMSIRSFFTLVLVPPLLWPSTSVIPFIFFNMYMFCELQNKTLSQVGQAKYESFPPLVLSEAALYKV